MPALYKPSSCRQPLCRWRSCNSICINKFTFTADKNGLARYNSDVQSVLLPARLTLIFTCTQIKRRHTIRANVAAPILTTGLNAKRPALALRPVTKSRKHNLIRPRPLPSAACPSHLTLRRLMSYIYGAPILDVSRSHTTTQHSR